MAENRMPAGEETKEIIGVLAQRALKATAELELISTELQSCLAKEAQELGILDKIAYYDFDTHEYVLIKETEAKNECGVDTKNGPDGGESLG